MSGDIMLKRMLELVPLYIDEKLSAIQSMGKDEQYIVRAVGCKYTLTVGCEFAIRGKRPDVIETFCITSVHRRREHNSLCTQGSS